MKGSILVYSGRACGKSEALLKRVLAEDGVVIVSKERTADYLREHYPGLCALNLKELMRSAAD